MITTITKLCKSELVAKRQLKGLIDELSTLQTKYFFTEAHGHIEDERSGVFDLLRKAEKEAQSLSDKLTNNLNITKDEQARI